MNPYMLKGNERGFTLVQLLVGLAVGLIALAAAINLFRIQQEGYNVEIQISEMQQNTRAAMDIITREVKMAGYDPLEAGFDGIIHDTFQLRIFTDITGAAGTPDGNTNDTDEDVTYKYYDDPDFQIKRRSGSSGSFQTVAENIETFDFSYLKADGTDATTTSEIRKVQITITGMTSSPDSRYTEYPDNKRRYTLISEVTPRNIVYLSLGDVEADD